MKDFRQANKGMPFEQFLRYANERYKQKGIAVLVKIPTEILPVRDGRGEVVNAKVCSKSSVDFIGRVGDMPVAIEAKHTGSDTIRWDAVQDHQAAFLSDFSANGDGISLVVVSFALRRFYAVPWECWREGRDAWIEAQRKGQRKAEIKEMYAVGEYKEWSTNGKASLKESDLLTEWEIKQGGTIGLDYLKNYRGMEMEERYEVNTHE